MSRAKRKANNDPKTASTSMLSQSTVSETPVSMAQSDKTDVNKDFGKKFRLDIFCITGKNDKEYAEIMSQAKRNALKTHPLSFANFRPHPAGISAAQSKPNEVNTDFI